MKFYLIVAKGKYQGDSIAIDQDLFLIGGGAECQLKARHKSIAAEHAALINRGRSAFITDFGNGEPTEVNGEAIPTGEEWPLHMGDRIKIGPLEFMIQKREKMGSRKDMEEWALRCLDENSERRQSLLDDLEESGALLHTGPSPSDIANAMLGRLNAQRGIVRGRLRIASVEGTVVVRLNDIYLVESGDLALLNKELRENLNRPNLRVLIDFKNVRRLSSCGATMFAGLAGMLTSNGGSLAFCRLRSELEAMMKSFPRLRGVKVFRDKHVAMSGNW